MDNGNGRVFLPKIGWIRYRKSHDVLGTQKNVTVSFEAGKWYVAIQAEMEVAEPIYSSDSAIGLDMGIAHFVAMSDGRLIAPRKSFKTSEKKLAEDEDKNCEITSQDSLCATGFSAQALHRHLQEPRCCRHGRFASEEYVAVGQGHT